MISPTSVNIKNKKPEHLGKNCSGSHLKANNLNLDDLTQGLLHSFKFLKVKEKY